ncbi:MAG: ABC transporter substrate-binding protein [Acidimicrobiales bacterium]
MTRTHRTRRGRRLAAALLAFSLAVAACGGGDDADDATSGGDDDGTPTPGGEVIYALEAETNDGWCLPESQLAISGIMVSRTIYDTLTAPNGDGEYVPYLAESVEPNADFTQWTIALREGITFHDDSPLTAQVVKNNLDAFRGAYPARNPLLFRLVFADIADVQVVDDLTVTITTSRSWVSLPAYLYSSGRLGIMAQAQLDDPATCQENLIGTGPFELEEWVVNDHLTASKNENYWQTDADGVQLPYLDEIEFRPVPEAAQRFNLLQAGEISATHESGGELISQLRPLDEAGTINLTESSDFSETQYLLLNSEQTPFDNILARRAVAHAINYEQLNQLRNQNVPLIANGPFAPGNIGFLEDTGFPSYDPDEARSLVEQYEQETGQPIEFTYSTASDPGTVQTAEVIQEMLREVGIEGSGEQVDQATLINRAIGGQFQLLGWRNHPGDDPDGQYVWWYSTQITNFGNINDPEIDRLLDDGRTTPDPATRQQLYEDLSRRFADQVWNVWLTWVVWAVPTAPDVHGVFGPPLPDGGDPFPGLASGHPTLGMWVEGGGG